VSRFYADAKIAPCSDSDRLAVRHSCQTLYKHQLYRESFSPDCWMTAGRPVPLRIDHDGETIGEIGVIASYGAWHHAALVVEDMPLAREKVRPGAKLSIGFRSVRREENIDLRIVRHTLVFLDEIALIGEHDVAGHIGAVVTRVYEPKPRTAGSVVVDGVTLKPGEELIYGRKVVYRNVDGKLLHV
jgi:hypothetical protein